MYPGTEVKSGSTKIKRAVAGARLNQKSSFFFHIIPGPNCKYAGEMK